jgi:hypothetical protein
MIIGYIAWPPDNDTYMWADPKTRGGPPEGVLCAACEQRIDYEAINPRYKPPRSYYDLSRCYDGDVLVSPPLRTHLEQRGIEGVGFDAIPSSRRYFILRCARVLRLIPTPATKREEFCEVCKQYRSVWGATPEGPYFEGVAAPIQEGAFFSDIRVGYYPQMGPLLIFGVDTWRSMVAGRFKGLGNGKPIIN